MDIKQLAKEFRLVKEYLGLLGEFWELDAMKQVDKYLKDITIENNTPRWTMGNGIPRDILALLFVAGKINEAQHENGINFHQKQQEERLAQYIEQQKNREYTEEELFEMRAAYGKGATVVNVITGKKITL